MGENSVSFRVLALSYFSIALSLALLLLFLGPVDQHFFAPDCLGHLASGWNVLLGYRPYVDFEVDTGLIPMLFMAMGEFLSGHGPLAFPLSVVIPLIPVSILIWYIISKYLRSTAGFFIAGYLILLWCDPVPLHFFFYNSSYANYYNRESYVLLSLLMIALCGRKKKDDGPEIGLLLGLLLFFKITYFAAGLFLVGGMFFSRRPKIQEMLYIGAGFLITTVPVLLYIGIDGLIDMIRIVLQMGAVRSPDILRSGFVLVAYEGAAYLALFGMLMWGFRIRPSVESALVLVAGYICEFGGCPSFELVDCPLFAIYALILFSRYLEQRKKEDEDPHFLGVVGLGWVFTPSCVNLFLGILYPLFLYHYYELTEVRKIDSELLGLKVHIEVAQDVNDGLAMLRKHQEAGKEHGLTAIDFCDPFSYALGIRSARYMPATPSVGVNMDATHHPAPERVLEGVDWVMEPQRPMSDKSVSLCVPDYMNYVRAHYKVLDHSPYWTLWERKD